MKSGIQISQSAYFKIKLQLHPDNGESDFTVLLSSVADFTCLTNKTKKKITLVTVTKLNIAMAQFSVKQDAFVH